MSVLVEAITLVIQQKSLDLAYPGGVEAFLSEVNVLPKPPRFACARDPRLVNVSFDDPGSAAAAIELLRSQGLSAVSLSDDPDFVLVDQRTGPTSPCPWLVWERFTDGVTVAWLANEEPGTLAAPDDWTPASSAAEPLAAPDDSSRYFRLSCDDVVETLLDLETGRELQLPVSETPEEEEEPVREHPLHATILAAMEELRLKVYFTDPPAVMLDLCGHQALYTCRYYAVEEQRSIMCYTRSPVIIPAEARRRVMEFITRANYNTINGGFEMDLDQGPLFYKTSVALLDTVPSVAMIRHMADVGVWAFDRYLPELMKVIYGKRKVAEAVKAAEE